MTRRSLTYIVSDIDKALGLEWVAEELREVYHLTFILIGKQESQLQKYLEESGITVYVVSDANHTLYLSKWVKVFGLLTQIKPDIVHTHLWRANLIGLTTSWLLGIKKRVFTRHHGMVHYDEHPAGRKWDLLCNTLATDIIAISQNVLHILEHMDKAKREKIHVVHHGFRLPYFTTVQPEAVVTLREKYGISVTNFPVVGVIARYEKWKGVLYAIQAFKQVLAMHHHAHLILANARGAYEAEIKKALQDLPLGSYTEVDYEQHLAALYHLFDVYVHVPTDSRSEAFGQTYVEALAAGVPSVFTLSGVASEFIRDRFNARVVDYENGAQIALAIDEIIHDKVSSARMVENGKVSVSRYTVESMANKLSTIYG